MRFEVLDSWRGVCALMVAAMHFEALHHAWGLSLLRHGYLFVDFFFVLSGFVITHAYGDKLGTGTDAARYVIRRFGRLWPLHATIIVAYIGIELVKLVLSNGLGIQAGQPAFMVGGRNDPTTLPSQFLLLQGLGLHDGLTWNMPSWSISAEFWTYIVFAVVSLAVPSMRTAALVVLGLIGLAIVARFSPDAMFATYDYGFPRAVAGFAAGHLAYQVWRGGYRVPAQLIPWLEVFAVLGVGLFVMVAGVTPLSLAAPLVFGLVVYLFSLEGGPVSRLLSLKPFTLLGLWSYAIYMTHDLVMHVMGLSASVVARRMGFEPWRVVEHHGITSRVLAFDGATWVLDILLILYLAVVLVLSALSYRYIEDPARRAFNRIADGLGRVRAA